MVVSFRKIFSTFGYAVFALVLAWLILFVSISRMSLAVLAKENNYDFIKNKPIALSETVNGLQKDETYKLPEVTMLPTNFFYGFKVIRDYFWISFSPNQIEKGKIAVFLADKKMAEMYLLLDSQQSNYAIEAANGALEKLKFCEKMINEVEGNSESKMALRQSMTKAGVAYQQMIGAIKNVFDYDQTKYADLTKGFDDWNQKQAAEIDKKSL